MMDNLVIDRMVAYGIDEVEAMYVLAEMKERYNKELPRMA